VLERMEAAAVERERVENLRREVEEARELLRPPPPPPEPFVPSGIAAERIAEANARRAARRGHRARQRAAA
jgi:hypothetical protein